MSQNINLDKSNKNCCLCNGSFDKSGIIKHKSHSINCSDCPNGTNYSECLHYFQHRQNKHGVAYPSGVEIYYCRASDNCTFKSLIKDSVKQHIQMTHKYGLEKERSCPICSKSFSSPFYVDQHIKRYHKKVKNHKCPQCESMFYDNQNLKRHILLKHTISLEDRKMDQCKQCLPLDL